MTEVQADHVATLLRERFDADVEREATVRPGRYRFGVVSPRFAQMSHVARQREIWTVIDAALPHEETLDVSMVLAFAPGELQQQG